MKITLYSWIPFVASLSITFLFYFSAKFILEKIKSNNERKSRLKLVTAYNLNLFSDRKNIDDHISMARTVIGAYSDQLVGPNYKSKLERMLVTSGDWENRKYSNLVYNKLLFALLGFSSVFIILLIKNLRILPLFVAVTLIAYFFPNVENLFLRNSNRKYSKQLKRLLDRSGSWDENQFFALVRRKLLFSINSFVLTYLYLVVKSRNLQSLVFSIVAILIGFFLPDVLLQNKVLKRKEAIANLLPDAIDMLQMCVTAGLSFPAALSKVAETQSGPISEEFARVTTEVQLGQSRSNALEAMADRTQEKNVQKFVSSMLQVDRFGIPIGKVLMEQSKEMRAKRRERAREQGQKVPIKILAPIMLCFLPAVLVIILGPAVLSIIQTFSK